MYKIIFVIFLLSTFFVDIYFTEKNYKIETKKKVLPLKKIIKIDDKFSYSLKKGTSTLVGCTNRNKLATVSKNGTRLNKNYVKSKNTLHIFGDSFTFGYGAKDTETFPYILSSLSEEINVINYGVPGWGVTQMYIYLKENLKNIKEGDIVLFSPIFEDFFRDLHSPKLVSLMFLLSDIGPNTFPIHQNNSIEYEEVSSTFFKFKSRLYLSRFLGEYYKKFTTDEEESLIQSEIMLNKINNWVSTKKALFYLTYLPEFKEKNLKIEENDNWLKQFSFYRSITAQYLNHKNKKDLFIQSCDLHYSKKGNIFIAKSIIEVLNL
jgi:hypothetical protein